MPDARGLDLKRGAVVATPGVFFAGTMVDVELRVLGRAPRLEHRRPVRFHTGTAEVRGVLSLLDRDALEPGEETVARVLLDEPVCCGHGDRFLLRLLNPVRTVGGGRVLQLVEGGKRYRRRDVAEQVQALVDAGSDPRARVHEAVKTAGPAGSSPGELSALLAIDGAEADRLLREDEAIFVHERGRRGFLHDVVEDGCVAVFESVSKMLRDKPLAASVSRAALRTTKAFPDALKDAVLDKLQSDGKVRKTANGRVLFLDRLSPLAGPVQQKFDALVSGCEGAGFRPSTEAELAAELKLPVAELSGLVARAVDEALIEIIEERHYSSKVVRRALNAIYSNCRRHDGVLVIPELRDELDTSRKYLIPLLEHVDGLGLTKLREGQRRLLPNSELAGMLAEELGL